MEQIAKALVEVQAEITNAPKNATNPYFESKYTDLATAVNHCRPVLAKHGLAIIQRFGHIEGKPTLYTDLIHESGEVISGELPIVMDANPQKAGSYITYMRRYSYLAMVGIAPEDDDGNSAVSKKKKDKAPPPPGEKPELITGSQIVKLKAMVTGASMDHDKFKELVKVRSCKDLTMATAKWIFDHWNEGDPKTGRKSVLETYQEKFTEG